MRILDKNKDYYDYLSFTEISDTTRIFDRRGSINIKDPDILGYIKTRFHSWDRPKPESIVYLGLLAGYTFYIFKIYDIQWNKISCFDNDPTPISYKIGILRKDIDYTKSLGILTLYELRCIGIWWNKKEKDIVLSDFELKPYNEGKIPILKETKIPSLVSPNDMFMDIENYLSSLSTEKDYTTKNITDIDKAINHGFDKKESFRNVK
jgi:hypothetical protein